MSPFRPGQINFPIVLAALVALTLAGCVAVVPLPPVALPASNASAQSAPARPAPAACPLPDRSAQDQARVLALVNGHRAQVGLPALRASGTLAMVAHAFACDLARRNSLSHRGTDGSTLRDRLARGGVTAALMAENVAAGQRSAEEVVAAWMASPHHRENILRPEVTTLGLGQADGEMQVWVLDLAS